MHEADLLPAERGPVLPPTFNVNEVNIPHDGDDNALAYPSIIGSPMLPEVLE